MQILLIAAGIVLTFAGSLFAGRLGGLGVTAIYGVTMAFFWMPPFFSLRVEQAQDIVALAFYGAAGLVLVKRAPSARNNRPESIEARCNFKPSQRAETKLSMVVASLLSSDLGKRLGAVTFSCTSARFILPCTSDQALRVLSDVVAAALAIPKVSRISICVGQRPTARRLMVAAHYAASSLAPGVVTIGKRDEDCDTAAFPGWPAHSSVTWFDNGQQRIFQISIASDVPDYQSSFRRRSGGHAT